MVVDSLPSSRIELSSEALWHKRIVGGVVSAEQRHKMIVHDIRIIVCFDEPIKAVKMVLITVHPCRFRLVPEPPSVFFPTNVENDGFNPGKGLGCHEEQLIAPAAPRLVDGDCLESVCFGVRQDPAQHPRTPGRRFCRQARGRGFRRLIKRPDGRACVVARPNDGVGLMASGWRLPKAPDAGR